jgi:hypothetical protein
MMDLNLSKTIIPHVFRYALTREPEEVEPIKIKKKAPMKGKR